MANGQTIKEEHLEQLQNQESVQDMKDFLVDVIQNSRTSQVKKTKLIRNIQDAEDEERLIKIAYYTYMAGEGLASLDSKWMMA